MRFVNSGGLHLERLQARLRNLSYEVTKVRFWRFAPLQTWSPALNVYRCENCLVVCVDLAGVEKKAVDLDVEPQRLLIRGHREAPEPKDETCRTLRVLAMEIDYGSFEREVVLPVEVDTERVTAEQSNGLLWVYLPLRTAA